VLFYPHPDPFLRDDVIFAKPNARLPALRERFPGRRLYAMHYNTSDDPITLVEIAPPLVQSAPAPDEM
jgi:hypothetical protein